MNATITSTCDAGQTELIRDDNGGLWRVVLDGADGTLAVEEVREASDGRGAAELETVGRAGVFVWGDSETVGDLWPKPDDHTYGVNCTDEFIVRNGEWVENDGK